MLAPALGRFPGCCIHTCKLQCPACSFLAWCKLQLRCCLQLFSTQQGAAPPNFPAQALLELPLPIQPALAKAQAQRPGEDVFEEGRLKMLEMAGQQGWLTEGGDLHCKDNGCWFVTAQKPAA